MKTGRTRRFLCALLSVLMLVSLLPAAALAAEVETSTWEQVNLADVTANDVVAITMTKGSDTWALPTVGNGSKGQPLAAAASVDGSTLSVEGGKSDFGWVVTANGDGTYVIKTTAGESLYVVKDNNGVRVGSTEKAWSITDGYLTAPDPDGTTRYLGVYNAADWRSYTSISTNIAGQTLGFWKYTGSSSGEQQVTITPIAEAKAVSSGSFTVRGVVTLIDGKNVYLQDATGGIDLYLTAAPKDLSLGDTVVGTGTRADYRGLPELSNATYTKDSGLTLSAKETTLGALTVADLCTYITVKDLEVLAIDSNNITVQDASGASINIYKPVLGDKTVAVGDKLTFTGALGTFSGYQLRNTVADEIVVGAEPYADIAKNLSVYEQTDTLEEGDRILVVNTANNKTLTTEPAATYYLAGADVAPQAHDGANIIALDNDVAEWTVAVNDNGTYGLTQGENTLAGNREEYTTSSGDTKVRMNITLTAADSAEWKLVDFGESGVFLVNAGLESGKEGGNVSLEWYSGRFCLYDIYPGNEAKNSAACAVTFYKLVREKTLETPETPTASPEAGEVEVNTEITFACATEGAVISYSVDNGETWTEGTAFTVTEAVTLLVKAAKDGAESEVAEFAYTIKDDTPEPTYNTVAEALAGADGAAFTVKGVVTMADGKNVYVQDETGGICLYLKTADSSIHLGDTVIGSGAKKVYRGLPELDAATAEKSSGLTLSAKETTIGAITTADVCTYVQLKALEVADVYDNNGAYSSPNITFTDASGATIQLYKAVVDKVDGAWALQVGDKVDVKAAVGINNATLQLRNTAAAEITPVVEAKVGFVTELAELTDGANVVILNPANKMALSQTYSGYYNSGVPVTVTDGKLSGFGASEVWTVGVNTDGTYTFSTADGKKLSMDTQNSSMPLDKVNDSWSVTAAPGSENGFYIQNTGRTGYRAEWYADKGYWSAYYKNNDGDLFIQQFYLVGDEIPEPPSGDVLHDGDRIVIYNASAEGSLGLDSSGLGASLGSIHTEVRDGVAYPNNGAYVFTVGVEGEYYTFSAGGKYLSTRNTEQLFMADEKLDTGDSCAYWQLEQKGDGYLIKSKTARYNNSGVVCIEFYSGAFSGWTFKSTEQAIFVFSFYPVHSTISTLDDVTNNPQILFYSVEDPVKGGEYKVTFTLDDLTPLDQLAVTATLNGEPVANLENDGKNFSFIVPAEVTDAESALNVSVQVTNAAGGSYLGAITYEVQDVPVFENLTPAPGSKTGDETMPLISVSVKNASDSDQAGITIGGVTYPVQIQDGVISWQPTEPLKEGRVSVKVEVLRQDGVYGEQTWSFIVGEGGERLYFGQLHSHTTYSDGSGSLDTALQYVRDLPESANVQFVAFTDHSNYFDTNAAANPEGALYDMSLATESSRNTWNTYRQTVADFNASQTDIVAIAGFEMTWSGGPGHINTFNSPGIVSRNNATLNQKTNDAGMKAYYALLSQPQGSETISQFNHPGKTFGNFTDFSYWDAVTDSRIFLVEVGNGEGQIGAGGYYPSYEQYIMALDKGWHVAPTNNQDNHKGRWGNANDARDVILTDDFSEQGIYDAIRAMRVYATEDKNLEIYYTMNDQPLGSVLSETPEQLNVNVQVSDPDASDRVSKVEVVANSGKVIHTWDDAAAISSGSLSVTLAPNYSYYFIRVTEADGDIAVTAPVWVGETLKLGISAFESGTAMPVTNEELTLKTTLYNSEGKEATVRNITYTTSGSKVLGVDTTGYTVPASGTLEIPFKYTPDVAKVMTITATVVMVQDGKEYVFTKDVTLDVQNADELVYIGIDASHHNEYVAGNYKDSMGNFAALAAEHAVRTVFLQTSEDLIAACGNEKYKAIVLTAPSRRDGSSLRNPYENYTDAEIAAIAGFNAGGGTVVLTGWSDYYEHYASFPAADHMAAQQNRILEALGSSLRIADDGTNDDVLNGGQTPRLYFDTFNMDNPLMAGVVVNPEHPNDRAYSEVFSHYGGASIYAVDASGAPAAALPGTVSPAVYAHATTYSADSDSDGLGGTAVPKYPVGEGDDRLLVMATEELDGKGLIVVSGAAFLSNFEVQAQISDGSADADTQKNYANYKVCENLISPMNAAKVSPIADVRAQTEEGFKFTIEGVVTSNASGYDKDTAFFDCIYVQDETAGICCFPVAGNYSIGDKVRITGTTDFYQGEPELQVTGITVIGEGEVAPQEVTAKDVTSRAVEGSLITVSGTVESFELANELVQTIMVRDEDGDLVRVFIDGYITTGREVENLEVGAVISVTGLASYDDTFNAPDGPFPRIRVRNRADVVCQPIPATELEITAQPKDQTVKVDKKISLKVTAVGDGLTYQWQYSTDNGETWIDSTLTKSASVRFAQKASFNGRLYRCVVTDARGNSVASEPARILVKTDITAQPTAQTGFVGDKVLLSVTATGARLKYQWQYSKDGGETWLDSTLPRGAKILVTLKGVFNGRLYRCVITDANGVQTISEPAEITVKPQITTQPADQTAQAGENVTVSVAATGAKLHYQWQYSADGQTWKDSTLPNASTVRILVKASFNGRQYRCVITDANGEQLISDSATITVG